MIKEKRTCAMARKDERERVLDDLISKFDDMNDERFFAYMQELREGKDGE